MANSSISGRYQKRLGKVSSYLTNVGKSVQYTATQTLKSTMPNTADFAETNKELFKEVYTGVRNMRKTLDLASKTITGSDIYKSTVQAKNNALEDIKSGKWYNEERENAVIGMELGGQDMVDVLNGSFNLDDFDLDMSDDTEAVVSTTVAVGRSIDAGLRANATSVSMAVAKSADYSVGVSRANTNAMMAHSTRMTNTIVSTMSNGMQGLHKGLFSINEFLTKNMQTHIENSTTYYRESTNLMQESTAILKEMLEMQRNLYKREQQSTYKDTDYGKVFSGGFDMKEYMKVINKNFKNTTVGSTLTGDGMFSLPSMIKTFGASPMSFMASILLSSLVPGKLKNSAKRFDDTLGASFAGMMAKLNKMSGKYDNNVMQVIGDLLGIKPDRKSSIDTSKYDKGNMPWNGIAQKSLVEVIPGYLARIEAAVTGGDERHFDPKSGKWRTIKNIRKDFKSMNDSFTNSASYDMKYFLEDVINGVASSRGENIKTSANVKRYKEAIEGLLSIIVNEDYGLPSKGPSAARDYSSRIKKKTGNDYSADMIETLVNAMYKNKNALKKMPEGSFRAIEDKARKYRDIEQGNDIFRILFNDSYPDKNGKSGGFGGSSLFVKDNKGNNIFFYLQNILSTLRTGSGAGRGIITPVDYSANGLYIPNSSSKKSTINDNGFQKSVLATAADKSSYGGYDEYSDNAIVTAARDYANSGKNNKYKADAPFLDQLLKAGSVGAKWNVLSRGIASLALKPTDYLASTLNKADQRMFDLVFGNKKVKDPEGKPIKGMLDMMLLKINESFEKLNKSIDDNILIPLKEKFGVQSMGELFTKLTDKLGLTDKLQGFKGKWIDPTLGMTAQKLMSAGRYVKNSVGDVGRDIFGSSLLSPYTHKALRKIRSKNKNSAIDYVEDVLGMDYSFFGNGNKYTKKKVKEEHNRLNRLDELEYERGLLGDDAYGHGYAKGTPYVPKTGVYVLSKGEAVIPSEANPLYGGITNKSKQIADERKILNRMRGLDGNYAEGTTKNSTGRQFISQVLGAKDAQIADGLFADMWKSAKADPKDTISSGLTGTIIGAGGSLLFGLAGGPIIGAAIGVGHSLLKRSTVMNKVLFGGVDDETGEYKEGIIKKKYQDAFKKYVPDVAKYGITGTLSSLILPFGPVGGLLIGGTLGYLKNNSRFQNFMFGEEGKDNGVFKKDFQEQVKKAVPSMAKGALAGIIAGPFGLVGNTILGSSIGLLTSTNTFKDMLIGKEDEDGNRVGGIAGALHEGVVVPLKSSMVNFGDQLTNTMEKYLIKPLKDFIEPVGQLIQNATKDAAARGRIILDSLSRRFFKVPFEDVLANGTKKLFKIAKIGALGAAGIATAPVTAPIAAGIFGAKQLGDTIRSSQINRGHATNMTAQERLAWRRQHKGRSGIGKLFGLDSTRTMDQELAGMDLDKLKEIQSAAEEYRYGNQTGEQRYSNEARSVVREANSYLKKTKDSASGKTLFDLFGYKNVKALDNAIFDGDIETARQILDASGKSGRGIPQQNKNELYDLLSGKVDKISTLKSQRANGARERSALMKDMSRLTGKKRFKNKDMRYYLDNVKTEIGSRESGVKSLLKDMDDSNIDYGTTVIRNTVNEIGDSIVSAIMQTNSILDRLINGGPGGTLGKAGKYNEFGETESQMEARVRSARKSNIYNYNSVMANAVSNAAISTAFKEKYPKLNLGNMDMANFDQARIKDILSTKHAIDSGIITDLLLCDTKAFKRFMFIASAVDFPINLKTGEILISITPTIYKTILVILKTKFVIRSNEDLVKIIESIDYDTAVDAAKAIRKMGTVPTTVADLANMGSAGYQEMMDKYTVGAKIRSSHSYGKDVVDDMFIRPHDSRFKAGYNSDLSGPSGYLDNSYNSNSDIDHSGYTMVYTDYGAKFIDGDGDAADDSVTKTTIQAEDVARQQEAENQDAIKTTSTGVKGLFSRLFGTDKDPSDKTPSEGVLTKLASGATKVAKWLGIGAAGVVGVSLAGHLSNAWESYIYPHIKENMWPAVKTFFAGGVDDEGHYQGGVRGWLVGDYNSSTGLYEGGIIDYTFFNNAFTKVSDAVTGVYNFFKEGKIWDWFSEKGIPFIVKGLAYAGENILAPLAIGIIKGLPSILGGLAKGLIRAIFNRTGSTTTIDSTEAVSYISGNKTIIKGSEAATIKSWFNTSAASTGTAYTISNDDGTTTATKNYSSGIAGLLGQTSNTNQVLYDEDGNRISNYTQYNSSDDNSIDASTVAGAAGRSFLNGMAGSSSKLVTKMAGVKSAGNLATKTGVVKRIATTAVGTTGKLLNLANKTGQALTESAAKKTLVDGVTSTKTLSTLADAATNSTTLGTKIINGFKSFFSSDSFIDKVGGFILKGVKTVTGKVGSKNVLSAALEKMALSLGKSLTGKVASSGLLKIANAIAGWSPLGIALVVTDFLYGYSNAYTILGVAKGGDYEVNILQKVVCGLVNVITNKFTLGLLPASTIIDIGVECLSDMFGVDTSALEEAQDEADEILDLWNEAHPDETYDNIEDYNNKDTFITQLKKAVSNATSDFVSGVKSFWGISSGSSSSTSSSSDLTGSARATASANSTATAAAANLKSAITASYDGYISALKDNTLSMSSVGSRRGSARHLYQNSSSLKNMPYGNSTIGSSGCAPVAAANLVNKLAGSGREVEDAASYAVNNGYVDDTGATDIGFFNSYLKSKGYDAAQTTSTSAVIQNLLSGNQTVLLGQDSGGSVSPYSTNSHFITASGIDSNGNVIVEDPDLSQSSKRYPLSSVLTNMNAAVLVGSKRANSSYMKYNKTRGYYGRASTSVNSSDKAIIQKAILVTATCESGLNYGSVNGSDGSAFSVGIIQWYNTRAYSLLINIISNYGQTASKALLGSSLYSKIMNNNLGTNLSSSVISKISTLLITASGKSVQDSTAFSDYTTYYTYVKKLGLKNTKAIVFAMDLYNQYPARVKTVVKAAGRLAGSITKIELSHIYKASLSDSVFGQYASRREKAYTLCSNLSDLSSTYSATVDTSSSSDSSDSSSTSLLDSLTNLGSTMMKKLFGTSLYNAVFGSDSDDSTTTSAEISDEQQALVDKMSSVKGKLYYSTSDPYQDPDRGVSSCASTVGWSYKKALGVSDMSWLAYKQAQDSRFSTIFNSNITENGSGTGFVNESVLEPGDLLFYKTTGGMSKNRPYGIGHVEMYMGDGKRIGHGGPNYNDMGTTVKSLSLNAGNLVMARRYNGLSSNLLLNSYDTTTGGNTSRTSSSITSGLSSNSSSSILNTSLSGVQNYTFPSLSGSGRSGMVSNAINGHYVSGSGSARATSKSANRSYRGRGTTTLSSSSSLDYTAFLKSIVEVLITIASNTEKLSEVCTLLSNVTGVDTSSINTTSTDTSTAKQKLAELLSSSSSGSSSSNVSSLVSSKDTDYILKAMTVLAQE